MVEFTQTWLEFVALGVMVANRGLYLQAKKVRRVQSAFEMFNRMMQTPGKSELTLTELRVSCHCCGALGKNYTG